MQKHYKKGGKKKMDIQVRISEVMSLRSYEI